VDQAGPSDRALYDAWLLERIRQVHQASKGRYGSPRVHAMLRRQGIRVGEKRVARVMRAAGLQGAYRRRRKGCTVPVEGVEPFGDLVGREFQPEAPNRVWCADIKQIKTGEGWLYLAAVQDLYSRRIVGWAMAGDPNDLARTGTSAGAREQSVHNLRLRTATTTTST
jgi:putative transposase